jgi:hypothetical protein
MATADEVYLAFGRIAELCQLFETDLGTALLAHEALEGKAYIKQDPEAARRAMDKLDKNTLGATLKAIRSRFDVNDDLADIFERALAARNTLMHGFFLSHGTAIHSDAGRDAMLQHIQELRPPLEHAYQAASYLTHIMMAALKLLKKVHAQ